MSDYEYIKERAIRIAYQAHQNPIYAEIAINWLNIAAKKVRPKFPFLAAYFDDMVQEIKKREYHLCQLSQ